MHASPLVLISGFLGAGKTTLLRHLLPLLERHSLAPFVILNDYSNARIDAASLAQPGRPITPISGSCICCDSLFELLSALLHIPPAPRRITLIEANGTSDPVTLLEHLLVNPELHQRFAPILQLTVIDPLRFQRRRQHNPLELLQAQSASHLLLSRLDSTPPDRLQLVHHQLHQLNPAAQFTTPNDFAHFLIHLTSLPEKNHARPEPNATPEPQKPNPTHPHDHDHDHDHDHKPHPHHHLSHAFVGLQVPLPNPIRAAHLQRWLQSLPHNVLRAKGLASFTEEPGRWFQFHLVDPAAGEAELFELSQEPTVPPCAVLIGVQLDEPLIRSSLEQILAS